MRHVYYLSVAGIPIQIESEHPLGENTEFLPFLTEACAADICVTVRKVDSLPQAMHRTLYSDLFCRVGCDRNGHLQKFFFQNADCVCPKIVATYHPDGKQIILEHATEKLDIQTCFYCLGFESILLDRDKISLHAACVETALGGILFSGVSGAGKSTQADLWQKHRNARYINGDRPILSKEGDRWYAWGSPYAGSSNVYVNDCCAVSAIVFPEKANSCFLRKLEPAEAFRRIWEGLTVRSWDSSYVEKVSLLAIDLLTTIPVYLYGCTPERESVMFLEAELGKEYET